MNQPSVVWRCTVILLISSIKRCPVAPAGSVTFIGLGKLTVEPAPLFHIGSNLTAYCRVTECQSSYQLSLHLNDVPVKSRSKVNCTTVKFDLINVQEPKSKVICKLEKEQVSLVVSGLDLQGGLPPSKPDGIICETTRSSDIIACSWIRGQQTHLPTIYNVSVSSLRENGPQLLFSHIQDAKEVNITRGILDDNTNYQLIVAEYNHFGEAQCDPFTFRVKDIVMPEMPHIMQVEFGNSSLAAVLQWNTTEPSEQLRPSIRLRTDDRPWEVREGTELDKHLVRVNNLRPLTEYQFQMRTCQSASDLLSSSATPSFTPRSTPTRGSRCSKWSRTASARSPGKGPSQQLRVWRTFSNPKANRLWNVTVLWKPLSPEDFSGEVQHYVIFLDDDQKQVVTCGSTVIQCSVQVQGEVQTLTISAVASYGTSPPAVVPLRHSGGFVPALKELTPASSGSAVLASWSWPETTQQSTPGEEVLHYVIEWMSVPASQLQWHTVAQNQSSTSVTGLSPGVRYNISLYAVTSGGVSSPSSRLVYSKELEPLSGPDMRVLVHKTTRILVQWDELPVHQQRGFITKYTVYIQTLNNSSAELNVTVPGSGPRQMWIDCPEGALALTLTASTSAGEGPRTRRVPSQPEAPAVGQVIVIIFIIALFIAIIGNLMCWSCVRKRIKQKCITWGPTWLVGNLPKPGNSNAIRLLEQCGSEPSLTYTHSDPPLSPITLISWEERDDVYPNIHVESSQYDSGQHAAETPLLRSDCKTALGRTQLEHVSYKPQVATLTSQQQEVSETEEEPREASRSDEEHRCSGAFEGLLGGLLSSVEVDFSNSPLGLTLCSVGGLSWPKPPPVLDRGVLPVLRGTEEDVGADSSSPRLQQEEITAPAISLTQYTFGTTLPCGYFPQVAAACDSQGQQRRCE